MDVQSAKFIWFLRGFPAQPASWTTFEAQLIERLKFYLEEYFNLTSKWVGFEVFIFAPEAVYHQLHSTSFRNIKIIPVDDSFRLPMGNQESQRPEVAQALSLEGTSVAFLAVGEVEESLNFLVGHQTKAVIFSARKDIDRDVTYSGNVRIVPWSKISRLAEPAIALDPIAVMAPSERAGWPTTSSSSLMGGGSIPSRDAYVIDSPLDVPLERETPTQVQLDLRTLVIAQYFERLQRWGQQQQQQSLSFADLSCQFLFGEDPSLYSTINPSEMKSVIYVDMDPSVKRYELVIRGISRAFVHLRARIIQEMVVDVINFRKVHELVHWDTPHRVAIVGSNFLLDREDALHASVTVHATSSGMFVEILALNPAVVERILGMILALRPTRDVLRTSRASLSALDKALVEDLRVRFSTVLEVDSNASRLSLATTKYDEVDVILWGFEELLVKSRAYLMNVFGPSAALPVPVPPTSSRHGHGLGHGQAAMRVQAPPSAGNSLFESSYPTDPFRDSLGLGAIGSRAGGVGSSITGEQLPHDPYMSASRDFAVDVVGAAAAASDLLQSHAGFPSELSPSQNNFDYYAATNMAGANAGHYPRSVSGMSTSSTISSLTTRRETIRKIHRGVYSFADREAGIFFFAFEQQFRDFLEKSFQVLVEDSDNGLDGGLRANGPTGRMGMSNGEYGLMGGGHGISNAGTYDAEPGSKNIVLKVAFYGNTPKNIASARAYLEQLNTTNLMRTQIYFPQVSARKYKEILNKRASQSTILNNLRLREASQVNPQDTSGAILVDPLRTKGFVNIRIKPPAHNQSNKRSGGGGGGGGNGQAADVTVTISGSLLTTGNDQFIKDLESEFATLDDEYMYQVVQIPYSHPMKRQLTIKSLREELIQRHVLVALKWEEGCRANGSVGTAKIWARSPASMEAILQEIRTAESMHLDAPSLMNASGAAEGRSPIPVELEQDITKDIVTVLDINRTILSMTKLSLSSQPTPSEVNDIHTEPLSHSASMTSFNFAGSRLGVTESSNQARKVTITTNTNGDAKVVVYLPDLTLRYVLLGPPLSQLMTDMLSRFTANGIKTKYPYRDRTDPHAALLIEGDPTLAVPAAHEALALITSATEELKSVHVIVSEEQHRALLSSDLALIKYIQGQVGVHLKLEPTMAEMEYAHALVDLRFHFKPISVDSVADRAMVSDVHPWSTLPTMALARGLLLSLNYRSSSSTAVPPMEVSVFDAVYGSSGWMDKVQAVVKFVLDEDDVPTTGRDAQGEEPQANDEEPSPKEDAEADAVVVPDVSSLPSFVTMKRGEGRSLTVTVSLLKKMEQLVEGEGRTVSSVISSLLEELVQLLTQLKVENVALLVPSASLLRSLDERVARPSETSDGENASPPTTPRQFFEKALDATMSSTLRRLVVTQESEPEPSTTTTDAAQEGEGTAVVASPDATAVTFALPEVRHFPSTLAVGAENAFVRTLLEQFERQDMSWYENNNNNKQGHYTTASASAPSRNPPSQSNGAYGGGFGAIGDAALGGTGADGLVPNPGQGDVRIEILACNVPFPSSALSHLVTAQPVFSHGMKSFIVKGLLPGVLSGLDLLRAIASPTALVMKAAAAAASAANASAPLGSGSGAMAMHMAHSADESLYALEPRTFAASSSASLSSISHSTLTSPTSFDAALHSSNSHTSAYAAAALHNKSNQGHYPPSAHSMSSLMGGSDLLGLNYAATDAARRYASLQDAHRADASSSGLSAHSGYGREYYPSNGGGGGAVAYQSSGASRGHASTASAPYMNPPYGQQYGGYAPSNNAYGGGPHAHHHSSQHRQQPQSRRRYNGGPSGYMGPGAY